MPKVPRPLVVAMMAVVLSASAATLKMLQQSFAK